MSDRSNDPDIDAGVRLRLLRALLPALIDSHPQPNVPLAIFEAMRGPLLRVVQSSTAGPQQQREARECLAELDDVLQRLQAARDRARRQRAYQVRPDPERTRAPVPPPKARNLGDREQ